MQVLAKMPIPNSTNEGGGAEGGGKKTKRKAPATSYLDPSSQLLVAIGQGKARLVRRLLDTRGDPNYQGGANMVPPLMLACDVQEEEARERILELLLNKGAAVNLQAGSGKTALMSAVIKDIPALTAKFLKHKADVSIVDVDGNTALNYAAETGNIETVKILVREGKRKGLDPDHQNLRGLTPLLLAAQEGHLEAARVLVEGGASLSKRDLEHFMTPLDWMKSSGCYTAQELQFLDPTGKKRNYYRQERMKKGIRTLSDYLPSTLDTHGEANSPNVFTMHTPSNSAAKNPLSFPVLQSGTQLSAAAGPQMKSMFDVPPSKKQNSFQTGHSSDIRRHSISFPSVSSVKTDLYKSSYLSKRKSLLSRNNLSEGYHSGALRPLTAQTTSSSQAMAHNYQEDMKNSRLPPIKK